MGEIERARINSNLTLNRPQSTQRYSPTATHFVMGNGILGSGESLKSVTGGWPYLGCLAGITTDNLASVQGLLSMFPQSVPGIALALLRISVANFLLPVSFARDGRYTQKHKSFLTLSVSKEVACRGKDGLSG
jgi:hypothetical protein